MKSLVNYWYRLLDRFAVHLVFLVYTVILALSLIPSGIPGPENSDKVGHFLAYTALSFLCSRAFPRRILMLAGINAFLGIAIEFIQYFIPGRSMSALDAAADFSGIAGGYALYRIFILIEKRMNNV